MASYAVQIVGRTVTGVPSGWAVVDGATGLPHQAASRFLRYLRDVERSPNTIRAYAYDLADYLTYLDLRSRSLDDASNELLASFARWKRSPDASVVAMTDATAVVSRRSVNRSLAGVSAFYTFLASAGQGGEGYGGWKRLQDSASSYRRPSVTVIDNVAHARRQIKRSRLGPRLPIRPARVKTMTVQQVHAVLEACQDHQQRLLIAMAFTTGMRLGQLLGLWHEDVNTVEREVSIRHREGLDNGVRSKNRAEATVPITAEVALLYKNYMHEQYGWLESNYVFVDLGCARYGEALNPRRVYTLLDGIRRRSGVADWSMHSLRHTFVMLQQEAGVPIDVISHLVTHASIQTTVDIYGHRDVENLRQVLIAHGAWSEER